MLIVGHFLFKRLPRLLEAAEVDQRKRLDGTILHRRDSEPGGKCGGAIAAGDTVDELSGTPVGPHRIEQMFIERDQVTASL